MPGKVFDNAGIATHKANGFYESAMAHKIDAPSTISLNFAITDMQKLKARMNSPEFKKVMADAVTANLRLLTLSGLTNN